MPVGGSVAEGVAILPLRGAMSESDERCLYEAVEHLGGGVGLPSRVLCPSLPLAARWAEALWYRVRVPSLRV